MITFGYKNKFNGPIRAVTALAVGIVMVLSKADALELVVRIIAAFIFASGLVSLAVGLKNRANGTLGLMSVNAIVDVVIGLALFMFPGFVSGLLIYIIGFILIGFGAMQLMTMLSANRVFKVGLMAFIMPVLVLSLGVFLIFKPAFVGEAIGVVAGAALIVYGVSELLSSWKMHKAIDEYEIHLGPDAGRSAEEDAVVEVKDVEYKKVDEK